LLLLVADQQSIFVVERRLQNVSDN